MFTSNERGIRKQAQVDFTRSGWRQFFRLNRSLGARFLRGFVLRYELAAYLILTAQCMISDPSNIHTIASYLKESGKVAFANRPGGFYFARIVNQIPFEKILRGNPHRSFAVNFRCQPFWYQENVPVQTYTETPFILNNPGSIYSEPVITVYGSGDLTLMIGAQIVELFGVSESITLDTPLMEAYKGEMGINHSMDGEFPILKPGANAISWVGDVTKIEIRPNWRFLV